MAFKISPWQDVISDIEYNGWGVPYNIPKDNNPFDTFLRIYKEIIS